ncbi:hypothetical protein M5689_006906 [Euphorbia peplus]|nr:hypothetical protein M5689_006906 [Euphorbia peplus]
MLDYVIDVYGLIIRLGNLERMRSLDQIKHKRSIFIEDASGVEIEVTLWDNIALAFPEDHVSSFASAMTHDLLFPMNHVEGFTLNITSGTKFFVNPEIPEIVAFAEQVIEPYPYLYKTAPLLDEETDIEDEKEANRKTVAELLQIDIHTDKEIKFACTATIKQINPEEGWWYRACPRCKSSVQNLDDKLWCKNCRFIDALPIAWYRISLIVEDTTGSAPFVLFGRAVKTMLGLLGKSNNRKALT